MCLRMCYTIEYLNARSLNSLSFSFILSLTLSLSLILSHPLSLLLCVSCLCYDRGTEYRVIQTGVLLCIALKLTATLCKTNRVKVKSTRFLNADGKLFKLQDTQALAFMCPLETGHRAVGA